MNVVLAIVLFTVVNGLGSPQVVDNLPSGARAEDVHATIMAVLPQSAAFDAGLLPGDRVIAVDGGAVAHAEALQSYIQDHADHALSLTVQRGDDEVAREVVVTPAMMPDADHPILGVQLVDVGMVRYPIHLAFIEGVRTTGYVLVEIFDALGRIMRGAVTAAPIPVDIAGPVGIAVLTGQIAQLGLIHLVQFTAVLSVNLALLNILPIPALDGGRLLILAIEAVRRRALAERVERRIHAAGFAFLIALVVVVTYRDIVQFGGSIMDAAANAVGLR